MSKRSRLLALVLVVSSLGALAAFGQGAVGELQRVLVTNWPEIFNVRGNVKIDGPVALAESFEIGQVLVSPVRPDQTTALIEGGQIVTAGFSGVVLSLVVEAKGEVTEPGRVGAFLVPVTEVTERAFREDGRLLFPLEVVARIEPGETYYASSQPAYLLGFPRYRVYFFNTTPRSVAVTLHGHLTSR